jgi:sugar-specific transcriptional regulator TrmB
MCWGHLRQPGQGGDASVGSPADLYDQEPEHTLIDRIRHDIQERLDQLLAEAEKLRHALAALDPRGKPTSASSTTTTRKTADPVRRSAPPATASAPASAAHRKPVRSSGTASSRTRTAPGATKTKVLGALSADGAMTAGEVAKAIGLARGTVSTTLSKLTKSGEVAKAERGYRLPAPRS